MKRPALQNKRFGLLRMAFRDFRETDPWTRASYSACVVYTKTANLGEVKVFDIFLTSTSVNSFCMHTEVHNRSGTFFKVFL